MTLPTFHITISGTVLALYGAVLSTITAAAQILAHIRDKAKIQIQVNRNMRIIESPQYEGMTLTIVNVSNSGRRPVTIRSIGAQYLSTNLAFVAPHCKPQCPHELTEGTHMMAIMDQTNVDHSAIEYWSVWDATGREYRKNVAPWYRRWISSRRRMRKIRLEEKEKLANELKSISNKE
jgi:hypothetical protein